eukprot:TRINITY_DN4253_c0_g2_i1.p1 TRINITY_DN4253_c0_g2~~TRINITY_DN4253_c0_g2_i1.p1  ORF type:complete len:258 (+),score=15.23 TRINITY_DN4253_c0_g2_i1:118-891(+)
MMRSDDPPQPRPKNSDPHKLDRMLRYANVANAIVLWLASFMVFFPVPAVDPLEILSAMYIMAFSFLLCCFETHFKFVDRMIYRDCGFMYRWYGRLIFFVFVGTLAFGLGIVGTIAGCVTIANVLFNLYVLKASPTYGKQQPGPPGREGGEIGDESRQRLTSSDRPASDEPIELREMATRMVAKHMADAMVSQANDKIDSVISPWDRIYDEESGHYYYYNNRTKESTWVPPKGSPYEKEIGRAVQQECRDRSRMPSSA